MADTKKRRQRVDTAKGQQEIMDGVLNADLSPPEGADLTTEEALMYAKIIRSKAWRAWTPIDKHHAADLARVCVNLERAIVESKNAPLVVETSTGTGENPLFKMVDRLAKLKASMCRMLQIHPEATQGKSHKQREQNTEHSKTMDAVGIEKQKKDDLINSLIPGMH